MVPAEAVVSLPDIAAAIGVSLDASFDGVAYAPRSGQPMSWADFARVHDNLAKLAGSDEALLRAAPSVFKTTEVRRLMQACALIVSPRMYFLRSPMLILPRLIPQLTVRTRYDGEWVVMELSLPEHIAPCRSLFVILAGISRIAPRFQGLPDAVVQYDAAGHSATVRVLPPPSKTIWAKLRRSWSWLANTTAAFDELEVQQNALREAIQDREVALAERQRALDEKERALRVRDRFLQNMGHELRTPINGLLNSIHALRDDDEASDARDLLEVANTSAARLVAALEATLSYAKVTSEHVVATRTSARPIDTLRVVAAQSSALAQGTGVQIRMTARAGSDAWWCYDDAHTQRALTELVRQAIQVSGRGQTIEVIGRVAHQDLTFEILDRGAGQYPASTTAGDGLADPDKPSLTDGSMAFEIVRAKVAAMQGEFGVRDRAGGGTSARIRIPVTPADPPSSGQQRRRVLTVDDDRVNRMVASRLLRRLGCQVREAIDGAEALETLRRESIDLVLMDCEMPVLDGWEATRRIRDELGLSIPIIAATAYASQADRLRCSAAGMDGFLAKPLDAARLDVVLNKWLGAAEAASGDLILAVQDPAAVSLIRDNS